MFAIDYLDLQITLRCNCRCRNCIKLCNMPETGLDYSQTDLTLDQVADFARQAIAAEAQIANLIVTGGEPLLHPQVVEIVQLLDRELVATGHVGTLQVNSNLTLPAPPAIAGRLINFSRPRDNPQIHDCVFVHPDDLGRGRPTFSRCHHYRKWRIVANTYGYSLCCAADGYLRLFRLDHLILPRFPCDYYDFCLDRMDDVCQHCPFGTGAPAKERDAGRPVSAIYAAQFVARPTVLAVPDAGPTSATLPARPTE